MRDSSPLGTPPVALDPNRVEQLHQFANLLLAENARMNLTAARDSAALWNRHIADSLRLLQCPEVESTHTLLDLGSGGGLPGIPLAIARPQLEVVLLEATRKKVRALQSFIDTLGLRNTSCRWGRAEELAHDPAWRQRFDLVTARAVAPLRQLVELGAPLCRPGGYLAAYKGPNVDQELSEARHALETLHCRPVRRLSYRTGEAQFHLLVLEVTAAVPHRYPRNAARIKQRPL